MADLKEVVKSHFPYFPVTFYMISYLRKLLHMKFKVYNGNTVRVRSDTMADEVKTPVMYSRLIPNKSSPVNLDGSRVKEECDCSVKLMLVLDKNDLVLGTSIDNW